MRRSLCRLKVLNPDGTLQPSKAFGFERAKSEAFKQPCIILVSPSLDRNVGSVARAMLNFGMWDLRVVNPECDIRSEVAVALSAGAEKVLENAQIYTDLKSCVADLTKVMSTTVRQRDQNHMVYTPSKAAEVLIDISSGTKTGIVFGRENSGLTNEEIGLSDSILTIPTYSHFSSINLAQSVNIVCYEFWKRRLEVENQSPPSQAITNVNFTEKVKKEDLEIFMQRIEKKLEEVNYRGNVGGRNRHLMNVRTFLQRVSTVRCCMQVLVLIFDCTLGGTLQSRASYVARFGFSVEW